LNPEIEEKLLNLQRYQENQAKGEPFEPSTFSSTYSTRGVNRTPRTYESGDESEDSDEEEDDASDELSAPPPNKSRRRGNLEDDDDEWVLDTPRKYVKKADRDKSTPKYTCELKKPESKIIVKTTDPGMGQIRKNIIFCNRSELNPNQVLQASAINVEVSPEKAMLATKLKMKVAQKIGITEEQMKNHKLQSQLLKHKENLKKIILKKRESLEKELQNEVQKELSDEMAIHIKNICAKQESIVELKKEPSKYMKKK
jgi:nucleosome-remodeling factor subunit BPTF